MRRRFLICFSLLLLGAAYVDARQRGAEGAVPEELLGVWTGTWEGGGGTGTYELTLEKGKDGAPASRVSVTGELTYKATIRTLSFDGKKMTAAYDLPLDETIDVQLVTTFEGNTAKGTWVATQKGAGEIANGTLALTKDVKK